ncbi:MAG: acyl-CoA desaturase [Bacteroidota bacterium]
MKKNPKINYAHKEGQDFSQALKSRIRAYFEENKRSRKGDALLIRKSIPILLIWLLPYLLILTVEMNEWPMLLLCGVIGFGFFLAGGSIMHEGCHGTFSSKPWLNKLAANSMYLLGGDKLIWLVGHNELHHAYTNIPEHDIDLESGAGLLRFSEKMEWKPKHQYQHYYAFMLYSLLTITWMFLTDFLKLYKFSQLKLIRKNSDLPAKNWIQMVLIKLGVWFFWLGIPILVLDVALWKILFGFAFLHLVAGIALTLVFQLAHLTEASEMPLADEEGNIGNNWFVHQLYTTANWAPNSKIAHWLTGGLNHQIEHHLFPGISHVHYPQIAPIVKQTAEEFGIPYFEYESFGKALKAHYQHLKEMGRRPEYEKQTIEFA